jgi:hypothetical protein
VQPYPSKIQATFHKQLYDVHKAVVKGICDSLAGRGAHGLLPCGTEHRTAQVSKTLHSKACVRTLCTSECTALVLRSITWTSAPWVSSSFTTGKLPNSTARCSAEMRLPTWSNRELLLGSEALALAPRSRHVSTTAALPPWTANMRVLQPFPCGTERKAMSARVWIHCGR